MSANPSYSTDNVLEFLNVRKKVCSSNTGYHVNVLRLVHNQHSRQLMRNCQECCLVLVIMHFLKWDLLFKFSFLRFWVEHEKIFGKLWVLHFYLASLSHEVIFLLLFKLRLGMRFFFFFLFFCLIFM